MFRMNLNKSAALITLICSLGFLGGCGPRGETKTLAEVLAIAQDEFNAQVSNAGDVKDSILKVKTNLETLINEQSDRKTLSSAASQLGDELASLTSRAGYTSRPALTELATQYRELRSDAAQGTTQLNQLKLMASRTYSALASELATTRFMVLPLDPK